VDTGGSAVKSAVKKWGKSASVRIPAPILEAARLQVDDPVNIIREEAGRIVAEPVERKEYELAALLRRISRRNLHEEIDFGSPAGKEVW
jgi:antitoxin MazE